MARQATEVSGAWQGQRFSGPTKRRVTLPLTSTSVRVDGDHTRHKRSPAELRRSERILRADQIAFRGLTKADATGYCGCSEGAFDT